MKVTWNWLKDFAALKGTPEKAAEALTAAGLPVASLENPGKAWQGVVTGKILAVAKHPKADRLTVCRVHAGDKELKIVCGAKNMKEGDIVPVATVGAVLPGGMRIEEATIRGEASFGMMCSKKELGIAEEGADMHAGLYILPAETRVGLPLAEALGMQDTILDIEVTPNRGDCLSVLGIARELAALTGAAWKARAKEPALPKSGPGFEIRLETKDLCGLYAGCVLENVSVGPSPEWMKTRLEAVGLRSINNVVDITNYVLWSYGQPLHAFDADTLAEGRIVVRKAKAGETIKTIDQSQKSLKDGVLVIADARQPVAVAGVMGGAATEVTSGTRRVFLEAAYFYPAAVRHSVKALGLASESSYRFERGVDPSNVLPAIKTAIALFVALAGAKPGPIKAVSAKKFAPAKITLDMSDVTALLGMPVRAAEASDILRRLGFGVQKRGAEKLTVTVPTHRPDIAGMADLAEEVARVKGYDAIPVSTPQALLQAPEGSPDGFAAMRDVLRSQGFDETVHLSFLPFKRYEQVSRLAGWQHGLMQIANPIDQEQRYLRPLLADALLGTIALNQSRGVESSFVFEIGHVFDGEEKPRLAFAACGPLPDIQWEGKKRAFDFFDMKGAAQALLERAGWTDAAFQPSENPLYQPGQACAVEAAGRRLGWLGKIHPSVAAAYDVRGSAFLCELDAAPLLKYSHAGIKSVKPPSRFPSMLRDIALMVDAGVRAGDIAAFLQGQCGGILEAVDFFDLYQGKNIPEGKKSLAFRLRYRSSDRTLTEAEVQQAHARIAQALREQFKCELREA